MEQLPNTEGKITISFKIDFEETDEIKEGNSFKSSSSFTTLEQLHEKAELLCINLRKKLSDKFEAIFKQTKLEGAEEAV